MKHLPLLLCLCACGATWTADSAVDDLLGESSTPAPAKGPATAGTAPPAPAATSPQDAAKAQALSQQGIELVRRFNEDRSANANAIVDAAIVFGQARALLKGGGDEEALRLVQANLFWCRKQMDLAALKDYLARKGADGAAALKAMDEVAGAAVPAEQAGSYLASAAGWANANPGDHLQVAIRFLEVAERFPSTGECTTANKRATEALNALMQARTEAASAARRSRFQTAAAATGAGTPIPDQAAEREALDQIRKTYAKAYAKRAPADRRRLIAKLVDETPKNRKDAAIYWALLNETVRMSIDVESYDTLLDALDQLGATFAGFDAAARKRERLAQMSKSTATAILRLLDTPDDPAANTVAGRWFCFLGREWEQGFRMLALGSDPALAKLAKLELDAPQNEEEKLAVADAWYETARYCGAKDEKTAMSARALTWYQDVAAGLTGLTKERVAKRVAELEKLMPVDLDNLDWKNLTASQWDRLKAKATITVSAKTARTESGLVLAAGRKYRVVGHPTETWSVSASWFGQHVCGWRGWDGIVRNGNSSVRYSTQSYTPNNQDLGALVCWIDNGPRQTCGIVAGPGRLFFSQAQMERYYGNCEYSGQIRVKVIEIDED